MFGLALQCEDDGAEHFEQVSRGCPGEPLEAHRRGGEEGLDAHVFRPRRAVRAQISLAGSLELTNQVTKLRHKLLEIERFAQTSIHRPVAQQCGDGRVLMGRDADNHRVR